jgi:hypothetical protein
LTTTRSSDTASVEASCNAAIAKKFLTDILANGPVVPLAPRATDPATTYPLDLNAKGDGADEQPP